FVFSMTVPEVPTAACSLLFPVVCTALMTVVGLSANTAQTISIKMATVAADCHIVRIKSSPQCMTQQWMTLAVSSRSPPGPGTLHHHYSYCPMNVWVEFWFGDDPPFFPAPTFS